MTDAGCPYLLCDTTSERYCTIWGKSRIGQPIKGTYPPALVNSPLTSPRDENIVFHYPVLLFPALLENTKQNLKSDMNLSCLANPKIRGIEMAAAQWQHCCCNRCIVRRYATTDSQKRQPKKCSNKKVQNWPKTGENVRKGSGHLFLFTFQPFPSIHLAVAPQL